MDQVHRGGILIEVRRLHPSEWDRLQVGGDGFIPDAGKSVAIVAENSSGIIGRTFLVGIVHIEGTHIEKAWRGGPVLSQLMAAIEVEAKAEGLTKLLSYSPNNKVAEYLTRLGYKQEPVTLWSKEL